MLIVNKDSVKATRQKLEDSGKIQDAVNDVKKMLEIKQTLLWRAEYGTCCGSLCNITSFLVRETAILEKALVALEQNDKSEAARLLKEYENILEASNEPGQPEHC